MQPNENNRPLIIDEIAKQNYYKVLGDKLEKQEGKLYRISINYTGMQV